MRIRWLFSKLIRSIDIQPFQNELEWNVKNLLSECYGTAGSNLKITIRDQRYTIKNFHEIQSYQIRRKNKSFFFAPINVTGEFWKL